MKSALRRINSHTIYLYSIVVGLLTGLAAVIFFLSVHWLNRFLFETLAGWPLGQWERGLPGLTGRLPLSSALIVVLVPTLGGLLAGLLIRYLAPEAAGSGMDVLLDAFHKQSGELKKRTPFVKLFASIATLGTGGSGGKEGPMALIGAGIGSFCGKYLKMGASAQRTLLLAGPSSASSVFSSLRRSARATA